MSAATFFTPDELKKIREAISIAEMNTSGEIRVHLESSCNEDVLDHAAYIFKALKMHKTALRNGVLFYISTDDHKFAILGDAGINAKVPSNFWDEIKSDMVVKFRGGYVCEGLCEAIIKAGNELKVHFPRSHDDQNELTNEISFGNKK